MTKSLITHNVIDGTWNWRGWQTPDMVYRLQQVQDQLEQLLNPEVAVTEQPRSCTPEEWKAIMRREWEAEERSLLAEVDRRGRMKYEGVINTNANVIAAIKAAVKIEDVLERYTKVFVKPGQSHRKQLRYQCTLHGPDKDPSGTIYVDEGRAWCHACNQGGDCFDIVQLFERCTLPEAISKLAHWVGLEVRPLTKRARPKGGVAL